jgi:hypothetical protein
MHKTGYSSRLALEIVPGVGKRVKRPASATLHQPSLSNPFIALI